MYYCENRGLTKIATEFDEYIALFDWHWCDCTCPIIDLYNFKKLKQDDHIRAYWEDRGDLIATWDITCGLLLFYPKTKIPNFNIGYPY